MLVWASEGGGLGFPRVTLFGWIRSIEGGIQAWEGKSKATEKVSYLGHPALSKQGTSRTGVSRRLALYLVAQLATCLFQKDLYKGGLGNQQLESSTLPYNKKIELSVTYNILLRAIMHITFFERESVCK